MRAVLFRFGSAGAYVIVGRVFQLCLFFIIARATSVETMGAFITSLTVGQLISTFSTFGLGAASQRIIPDAIARKRGARVVAFLHGFCIIILVMTVLIVTAIWLLYLAEPAFGLGLSGPVATGLILFVPVLALSINRELLARAFGAIGLAYAPRDIIWSAALAVLTLILHPDGMEIILIGALALFAIEIGAIWTLYKRHLAPFNVLKPSRLRFQKTWLMDGAAFIASSLGGQGFERIDTLYVASMHSLGSAGVYGLCSRLAPIASMCQRFIVPVLLNRFSTAFAKNDISSVYRELAAGIFVASIFALPLIVFVYFFGEQILFLFGDKYTQGTSVLITLVIAHTSIAIGSNFGALILSGPRPGIYGIIIIVVLFITVLLFIIIRPVSLQSVAFVVTGGIIGYNILLSVMGWQSCTHGVEHSGQR